MPPSIMSASSPDLGLWQQMADALDMFEKKVTIALIGKYTGLQDSYLSVIKALKHASIACGCQLQLSWVEATHLEQDNNEEEYLLAWNKVKEADGVIVPGGFGNRGFLGKVLTAEYCRIHKKPYLGVCLGFQAQVVEYARNVLDWKDANSAEFVENDDSTEECSKQVVIFMPEIDKDNMGGTMRLGTRVTKFTHKHADGSASTLQSIYSGGQKQQQREEVLERHRHRYEVNPEYVEEIHEAGLKFVGRDETGTRMEVAELPREEHPYYIGCQYHPEFLSRPLHPSPPFHGLILAAIGELGDFLAGTKQQQ